MTKKIGNLTRREILGSTVLGAVAAFWTGSLSAEEKEWSAPSGFKGNIKQSVSLWCLGKISVQEACTKCKKLGMVGIDLIKPEQWATLKEMGMIVTMGSLPNVNIPVGINRLETHEQIVSTYKKYIPIAAELGVPNLISLSGNRDGMDDETGMNNCAIAMKEIMPLAEKHKVTINIELLNKYDHKDYMCDRTEWAVDLCKKVGSPRMKILYDIYHMQRMEGEIINTIKKNIEYIGHFHTGGSPGRKDIDDSQELNYRTIMKAILETGYQGFVAHEFLPKKGFESLYNAVVLCDV